nr:PREDICTED: maestro heat-like repeat-containing protein family member 2B isoform X1 [Anolis carolinensis]|eukprot:XP_008119031.1 PREDICTED: maestro heat-like repeat-containing protein family member 2B isoform X1 [Anolis carolinensis]
MLGVLVRRREQQEEIIRNIPKVLLDSKILDSFFVAKMLSLFLDVCEECKPHIPKKIFQTLCDFVFKQILPVGTPVQQSKKSPKIVERFFHHSQKPEIQTTAFEKKAEKGESSTYDLSVYGEQQLCRDHCNILMDSFGHLVSCCPAEALDFLQTQMKEDAEEIRVEFLRNLKMIVGRDEQSSTKNRKKPIVEAVKCLMDDHRQTVRKAILSFIKELLRSQSVEGCAVWDMVAYIFQQFTVPFNQPGKDHLPNQKEREKEEHIQELCIDALEQLNTSAEGMSKALWPKLLLFVVPAPYTPTLVPLCRCLKELAAIRQDESILFLGSCKGVNLPSAQGIMARLLVLASNPTQRGSWALQLLHVLHSNIHSAVRKLWSKQIPCLWEFFQVESPGVSSPEWQQKLLQFLRRSLETIDDNTWSQNLSRELENQMTSYSDQSTEKSFLYKALGVSLASCDDLNFVQEQMQHLIKNANYLEASEREKVIQVLSFSAVSHFDLTLATLHAFGAEMGQKIQFLDIVSRYKDYQRGRRSHIHQTLMLTYGKVAAQGPKELLLSRVENGFLKRVLLHHQMSCQVLGVSIEIKDMNLKLAFVQSTIDICQAIHQTKDFQNVKLSCKKELLDILLDFMKDEPLDSLETPLRQKAITAIAILSKVKPLLSTEDIRTVLDESIKSLFPLPPLEQLKEKAETEKDVLDIEELYTSSMDAFGDLLKSIIEENPTSELLDEMFQLIDPWFTERECSRERALQASFQVLAAFQENVHLPEGENFPQFGSLVAFLAPYTCDRSIQCRQWAAQCITCLMYIQAKSKVTYAEEEEMFSAYAELQGDVSSDLFNASTRMAKVISVYFPSDQALDFIEAILEDLVSGNQMCAMAAGHWLLTILQDCGDGMEAQISAILDVFYSRLPTIKQDDLRGVLVDAVSVVAHFHLDTVFNSLLCRRLPMDSETGELWRSLGQDPVLALLILHKLAVCITQPSNFQAASHSGSEESEEVAEEEPLKATCAIYEVLSVLEDEDVLQELFTDLLYALLWQVSKTLGQRMPFCGGRRRLFRREQQVSEGNPCRLSVASLKALILKVTSDPSLAEIGEVNVWALLRDPETHQKGVCVLTSRLFQNGLLTPKAIQNVLPWMNSESEKLRLTGIAFFTEVIQDPMLREREQLRSILTTLLQRAGDQHPGIRRMALKGLGNIVLVAPDKVKKQKKTIVAILLGALYDAKVVLESLEMLALVLPRLKQKEVSFLFKDITLKTTTYMSDDNTDLRKAALHLFGVLAEWTKLRYKRFFTEQVRKSLVPLLIHQRDPSPKVSEACRATFLKCVQFLAKRKLRGYIEELYRVTNLNLPNLQGHICVQVINAHPELRGELLRRTAGYFQSSWEELQTRALELTGVMLESMQVTDLDQATWEFLLKSLETFQKSSNQDLQEVAADLVTYISKKWGELPERKETLSRESINNQEIDPYCVTQPDTTLEGLSTQSLHK